MIFNELSYLFFILDWLLSPFKLSCFFAIPWVNALMIKFNWSWNDSRNLYYKYTLIWILLSIFNLILFLASFYVLICLAFIIVISKWVNYFFFYKNCLILRFLLWWLSLFLNLFFTYFLLIVYLLILRIFF